MNVQHCVNCNDAGRAGMLDPNMPCPMISRLCAAGFGCIALPLTFEMWNIRAVLIEWNKRELRRISAPFWLFSSPEAVGTRGTNLN